LVLGGGLLLAGPGCGEDADARKPPPHECLKDSDCGGDFECRFFRCVEPPAGGGGSSGGGSSGGGSSGGGNEPDGGGGIGPSSGGGGSGGVFVQTPTDNVSLTTYPIRASALVADDFFDGPFNDLIFATVPSDAPTHADSLVTIDPLRDLVLDSLPVGSDPSAIALSPEDPPTLWVGLRGDHALVRIEPDPVLPVVRATFPLPLDPAGNETTVKSMTLYSDTTVLAALQSDGHYSGLVVLDDGVPRSKQVWSLVGPSFLTGGLDGHAFGFYDEGTTYEFYDIFVDKDGVTVTEVPSLSGSPKTEMRYHNHFIVTSQGDIINVTDPAAPFLESRKFAFEGLVSPDVTANTVFMFTPDGTLRSLDFKTVKQRWYGRPRRAAWSSSHDLIRPSNYYLAFADDEGGGTINQIHITKP
jgi:hypothetical protein